jgi:uncharacterized protein YciI
MLMRRLAGASGKFRLRWEAKGSKDCKRRSGPPIKFEFEEGKTMALFAMIGEYADDQDLRLRTRPVHREYLRTLFDAGKIVMSGPWEDETGLLIVYEVGDMTEAERLLAEDPYRSAGVLANATIKEWRVVLRASWSDQSA